jgi:hypothetical protein
MQTVVSAQAVVDRCVLRVAKDGGRYGERLDLGPKLLQVSEPNLKLRSGNTSSFANPCQCGHRLNPGESAGCHCVSAAVSIAGDVAFRLVDKELDQGTGIEIEAQRRPSETYSAAVLPEPRSLIGFLGRLREPFPGLTVPSAISASMAGDLAVETILATGLPWRVTVIGSPVSTRSMIWLRLFFSSRMPTVSLMWPHRSKKAPHCSQLDQPGWRPGTCHCQGGRSGAGNS